MCDKCKNEVATYCVNGTLWLCTECYRDMPAEKYPESIAKFACGLQLDDEEL